ncbi:MAG: CDP-alcohol phosphatidyltransferase family protein [Tyzzerella sp.]|nr:CDP-alcohol phosphatidyltransferase family protein [Tyzzerella sp.]
MKKREYFTIPNLMGYFRILLIPVFLYLYYHAETMKEYGTAFGVLVISFLTDLFDGKIARKFNMVTDFGKMLDPIADKLTQGAMAIAISFRNPFMIFFVVLFACKEIYMGVMGLYILKKYGKMNMAQMFGKICTTVLDVGVLVLLFFTNMALPIENVIIGLMICMLIFTWVRYIVYHVNEIKELQNA